MDQNPSTTSPAPSSPSSQSGNPEKGFFKPIDLSSLPSAKPSSSSPSPSSSSSSLLKSNVSTFHSVDTTADDGNDDDGDTDVRRRTKGRQQPLAIENVNHSSVSSPSTALSYSRKDKIPDGPIGHRVDDEEPENLQEADEKQLNRRGTRASSGTLAVRETHGTPTTEAGEVDDDFLLYRHNKYWNMVDALPYVDPLSADIEESIKNEIRKEEEIIRRENQSRRPHDYLSSLPVPVTSHLDNRSSIIFHELQRMREGRAMELLDMSKFTQPLTSREERRRGGGEKKNGEKDAEEPEAELKHDGELLSLLLEYSHDTNVNLTIMNKYAQRAWLKHTAELEQLVDSLQKRVKYFKEEVEETNKKRKMEQMEIGNDLRNINNERQLYIQKNKVIRNAIKNLEDEILTLKKECRDRKILPLEMLQNDDHLKTEDELFYINEMDDNFVGVEG